MVVGQDGQPTTSHVEVVKAYAQQYSALWSTGELENEHAEAILQNGGGQLMPAITGDEARQGVMTFRAKTCATGGLAPAPLRRGLAADGAGDRGAPHTC